MTEDEEFLVFEEVLERCAPDVAHKMRVMFAHIGEEPLSAIEPMNEMQLRNFLLAAAQVIGKYELISDDFDKDQRVLLCVETIELLGIPFEEGH